MIDFLDNEDQDIKILFKRISALHFEVRQKGDKEKVKTIKGFIEEVAKKNIKKNKESQ